MKHFGHIGFRVGPALLTLFMIAGSAAYYPWRHFDSWMAYAILFGALATAVWHLVLLIVARPLIGYFIYAFSNLALYTVFGLIGLYLVTGDSL